MSIGYLEPLVKLFSPGLFLVGLFSGEFIFSEGLIIGREFASQNGLGLKIRTANTNSLWACIWEGLLSEGFL